MISGLADMFSNPFWSDSLPDPFVLKIRGHYYAYGTERDAFPSDESSVFSILTSDDLAHWREVGKAMPALGQPYSRYWAPEVTVHNGQFLLYYTVHTEEFNGGIRVAVADRPEGPFIDSGHNLTSHLVSWAIDPHVFRDSDGQWYLYMTVEDLDNPHGLIGTGNVVDRLIDPFTLSGRITRVTSPAHPWQLFEAQRQERDGIDWYTVEGPTVIRHRRRYYEMFSGGCFYRDNYAVSYATSTSPMGPAGLQDRSWHEWEGTENDIRLIYGDSDHLIGPGHNSLVLGPNNVDLYIVYHAWQPDMTERRPCLDRLFWHGDELWTAAPTYAPQPVPMQPRLRELFEQPALQPSWHQHSGCWCISTGEVVQEDGTNVQAVLQHQDSLSTAWLLEVNLRYITGVGSYGVLLQSDAGTTLQVTIRPDSHLAVWTSESPAEPLQMMPLPDDVVATAWHQLIISFSGSLLRVQLDYLRPMEAIVERIFSTCALLTDHCSAAFSGISLTDHFRDEFLNDKQTPGLLGWANAAGERNGTSLADWRVQDGTIEQTSAELGEHIILKGSLYEHYEFSATMILRQADERRQPAFGLVAWRNAEEKLLVWLLQAQSGWTLTVESKAAVTDTPTASTRLELGKTFDPYNWHTLRLRHWDNQLALYLDGPEVLTMRMLPFTGRIGLVTRDATAAFTSVWQTGS